MTNDPYLKSAVIACWLASLAMVMTGSVQGNGILEDAGWYVGLVAGAGTAVASVRWLAHVMLAGGETAYLAGIRARSNGERRVRQPHT